jgi:diguanylate cyclase (GGDEF)-like protein/PAS domain S-box-containing protein
MDQNKPAEAAPESATLDDTVRAEQIRLLIENHADRYLTLLVAAIVIAVVWKVYPAWLLAGWFGLSFGAVFVRSWLGSRYSAAPRDAAAVRRWAVVFAAGAAATGSLWGCAGTIALVSSSPALQFFSVMISGGMMAGGVMINAAYFPAMAAFAAPAVVPGILVLFSRGDLPHIGMGVLLALFSGVIMSAALKLNRVIVQNIEIRFQNIQIRSGRDELLAKLQASEAGMAQAQRLARAGSWDIDLATGIIALSPEAYNVFGFRPEDDPIPFASLMARIHPDDLQRVSDHVAGSAIASARTGIDFRMLMAGGAIKYVNSSPSTVFDADGRALRIVGSAQDVTERRLAEERLQFANMVLNTQMEASPDGILAVDAERRVVSYNQRFADMWQVPLALLEAGDAAAVLAALIPLIVDPQPFLDRMRYLMDHPGEPGHDEFATTDGRFIERHSLALRSTATDNLGRVWFLRDVTARRTAEARALHLARYDVLTGLANRAVFVEAVKHAIASAKRGGPGFAVLYLDLDHFKNVNDTLGHPAGDALLKEVAARLTANTRETDTVGRFGGDEFAIVAAGIKDPAGAAALADKLIAAVNAPFRIEDSDIHTAASIGIDLYSPGANDVETLLAHADVALYRSKTDGRGIFRFFTAAMDRQVRARATLGYELREAIAGNQLFLLYQPQVEAASGRITGIEALVRWRHPTRGVLAPGYFIPVAEATGVIGLLGHFVLWQACRQAKDWLDAGLPIRRISVNISALEFKSPGVLEADIMAALAATGLPPRLLELEMTESVLMVASREHDTILRRLRALGVKLAIDDFGTGYSSLDYLCRFPVDHLKIAHSFTKHVESGAGDASIVRAIIGLARELHIDVIAEGVETRSQLALLESWNCGEVQGFYFARPMEARDMAFLLRDGAAIQPAAVRNAIA